MSDVVNSWKWKYYTLNRGWDDSHWGDVWVKAWDMREWLLKTMSDKVLCRWAAQGRVWDGTVPKESGDRPDKLGVLVQNKQWWAGFRMIETELL